MIMEGRRGGTFVGGKGGGWVGGDPLVPGLHGPNLGVTGLRDPICATTVGAGSVSCNIDDIKKKIKEKFEGRSGGVSGRIDVICQGLMLGHSGLAKAMRNITYWLDKLGCNVRAVILDGDNIGSRNTIVGKRILELSRNESVRCDGGTFYISSCFHLAVKHHPGCFDIPYLVYETVDLPQAFVNHLKSVRRDEIWTPSSFCRDSMVRSGLEDICGGSNGSQIKVMPHGVDTYMFSKEHADAPRLIPGNLGGPLADKFKFLTVMSFNERKGVSLLIKAFVEEFGLGNRGLDARRVALYLKGGWHDAGIAIREVNRMISEISGINNANIPYIHYDFNVYPDDVMASLYKACDCFVLPSRGEGYGIPYSEAMSMGLPTIGTRWSGNLEFMNSDNSYLIDVEGFAPEPRCDWVTPYYKGQSFAVPSIDHLRKLMRYVFENQEEAKRKGRIAREYMVKNFDWSVTVMKMKKRLEEIAKGQ